MSAILNLVRFQLSTTRLAWGLIVGALLANSAFAAHKVEKFAELAQYYGTKNIDEVKVEMAVEVNHFDPQDHILFVRSPQPDSKHAVFVRLTDPSMYDELDLRAGTRARVSGWFLPSAHVIRAFEVKSLSHQTPQPPREVDVATLNPGEYWSHRVRVRGVIESVAFGNSTSTTFFVRRANRVFQLDVHSDPEIDPQSLVGARVEAVGTMDYSVLSANQPMQAICRVMEFEDVRILDVGKLDTPTDIRLDQILTEPIPKTVVRFEGQITYVERDEFVLVEDGFDSIVVQNLATSAVDLGQLVVVTGLVVGDTDARKISAKSIEFLGISPVSQALQVEVADVVNGKFAGRRVTVSARFSHLVSDGHYQKAILHDGDDAFAACVVASKRESLLDELGDGAKVRVTGLVVAESEGESRECTIRLSAISDFVVEERVVRISRNQFLFAMLLTAVAAAAALAWIFRLRSRVQSKSRDMRAVTAHLKSSFDAAQEGILITDYDRSVVTSNRQLNAMFDIADSSSAVFESLVDRFMDRAGFRQFCDRLINSSGATDRDEFLLRGDDEQIVVVYSAPIRDQDVTARVWTFTDVTERRRMASGQIQSQRMEAVGRLAGGIAHDFNNLLMVISGNLELARRTGGIQESGTEFIDSAEEAIAQATRVVENLVSFSKRSELVLQAGNLNSVVERMEQLLSSSFASTITLKIETSDDLWPARYDETQMEQFLLNLCFNARDSLPDGTGNISVLTANTMLDGEPYVQISVTDDGIGMPNDVRERVFEPYFTTRSDCGGIGLGLSMSYGILQQHEGQIEVSSTRGEGSCFRILLPRCEEDPDNCDRDAEEAPVGASTIRDQIQVLIADDEMAVLTATDEFLTHAGFRTRTAQNGHEVLDSLRHAESHPDIIVMDNAMPVMSGRMAFKELAAEHPEIPVVICSGYLLDADDFASDSGVRPVAFLRKPYRYDALVNVILRAVDARSAAVRLPR